MEPGVGPADVIQSAYASAGFSTYDEPEEAEVQEASSCLELELSNNSKVSAELVNQDIELPFRARTRKSPGTIVQVAELLEL